MKRIKPFLAVSTCLAAGLTAMPTLAGDDTAGIPEAAAVVTVKDFTFASNFSVTENAVGLEIDRKGDILTGILFTGDIQKVTPEGKASHFATLPITPVPDPPDCPLRPDEGYPQKRTPFMTGFALHNNGDLYAGLPSCTPATHGIWRVSEDGSKTELFASLPVEDLPKGLAFTNGGFPLYVTDLHDFREEKSRNNCRAALGTADPADDCTLKIWRINRNGEVDTWIESALFYGNPDSPLDHPHGVNGIVVDKEGKNVYVTVTDYGRVVQIPIKRNGKAGEPEVIFESEPDKSPEQRALFGIDGIKIGPDGNFYIVVIRTDQLVAIKPGDSTHTVIVEGHPLDGPTQLAFGSNQRGKGDDENDHRVKSLPPLYIANGTGRRAFFLGIAAGQGGGSLWNGVKYLIDNGIITEDQAIGLQPRPSVARVLLKRDSD